MRPAQHFDRALPVGALPVVGLLLLGLTGCYDTSVTDSAVVIHIPASRVAAVVDVAVTSECTWRTNCREDAGVTNVAEPLWGCDRVLIEGKRGCTATISFDDGSDPLVLDLLPGELPQ
jgi:hypothetical protein